MQTSKESVELMTNQIMAEGANLLQMIEDNTLLKTPKHTLRLLSEAIENLSTNFAPDYVCGNPKANGFIKLKEKLLIPQKEFPYINFKGCLLGAGGKTLRKIQEETESKIMILGAGSMKSAQLEESLKKSGNSLYKHLKEPLHISIISEGPPMIAFTKMGLSLKEITKNFLSAVMDDLPMNDKSLVEQICMNIEKVSKGKELEFTWNVTSSNN